MNIDEWPERGCVDASLRRPRFVREAYQRVGMKAARAANEMGFTWFPQELPNWMLVWRDGRRLEKTISIQSNFVSALVIPDHIH